MINFQENENFNSQISQIINTNSKFIFSKNFSEKDISNNDISTQGNLFFKKFKDENKSCYPNSKDLLKELIDLNQIKFTNKISQESKKILHNPLENEKSNIKNLCPIAHTEDSILSDFKNSFNENLSSVSKYLRNGGASYNENIFYDKNFNLENNKFKIENGNPEDIKEMNTEILLILDKVTENKIKGNLAFKAKEIDEAIKEYKIV